MSSSDAEKNIQINKSSGFPMDLAQKIAMVKPTDGNKCASGTVQQQTQQTFRTITQPQMRMITMPVQTTGTGQIIQTHIMPQAILKPVDTTGRTQITSSPARTITQGSITVSRSTTPATYVSRGPTGVTNMQGIRTPTPPSIITNISSGFVRGTVPPKIPSPAGNVLTSPGSTPTWISGSSTVVQVPAQLIRNPNINQSPRQQHHTQQQQQHQLQQQRIVTQTTPINVNTSIGVQSQQLQQSASQQTQSQQIVTSQNSQQQQQQQQFVATLATVIPSRQPSAATLVYSNAQQHYGATTQRLAVATSLGSVQRQGRPIQLSTVRLPNTGMGVRVSTANIRTPSVPVLAPTSVLTGGSVIGQNAIQGRVTTGALSASTTTNLLSGNIPATRIIQVQQQQQQQQQTGTTQVVGGGRIAGNLMTLHPVIVNTTTTTGNRNPTTIAAKVQPSLTITHVKSNTIGQNTASQTSAQQTLHQPITPTSSTASATTNQQITQIVSVNQQGIVNQGHQIVTVSQQQLIGTPQNQSGGIATAMPVSMNSRTTANVLTGTINTIPQQTISSPVIRGVVGSVTGQTQTGTSILPIAKVLPQQQHPNQQQQQQTQMSTDANQINVGTQQTNVLIHTRSPSSGPAAGSVIPSQGQFLPTSGTFYYEHTSNSGTGNPVLTLTASSVNSGNNTNSGNQIGTSNLGTNLVSSVTYAPSAGSFAVVPTNNRSISQIHGNLGIVPTNNQQSGQLQAVPVRFNPQLIVDGSQTHQGTHQIISMPQGTGISTTQTSNQNQQTHMLIPVSSTKLTASPRPSILRKRDNDGPSPIKVAKNLGPTLISIGNNTEREHENDRDRDPSPQSRPGSSEGSTTASAISSPCLDQQDPEEIPNIGSQNDMQFKPVETMYPITQSSSTTTSTTTTTGHLIQHQISTGSSSNDNDVTPRKKPRKQQLGGDNIEPHLSYINEDVLYSTDIKTNNTSSNKENAHPVEVTFKKPRTSLLENYKQTFKPANNHFQRYADVRPREERRPNVMDLANQAHVLQKVNGWKIYHLSSQMEELCELESQVHRKLSDMLQSMEAHDSQSDIERVTDLIKGNRQRSKVIIDGVQDARSQIMKIFDHKAHVSDIIHRCASKRNFKKREKM